PSLSSRGTSIRGVRNPLNCSCNSFTLTMRTESRKFSRTFQLLLYGTARLMRRSHAPRMPPHLGKAHTAVLSSDRHVEVVLQTAAYPAPLSEIVPYSPRA